MSAEPDPSDLVAVRDLTPGMMVDLERDPYADDETPDSAWGMVYGVVLEIEQETPDCIRVDLQSGDSYGMPPGHMLRRVADPGE